MARYWLMLGLKIAVNVLPGVSDSVVPAQLPGKPETRPYVCGKASIPNILIDVLQVFAGVEALVAAATVHFIFVAVGILDRPRDLLLPTSLYPGLGLLGQDALALAEGSQAVVGFAAGMAAGRSSNLARAIEMPQKRQKEEADTRGIRNAGYDA